MLHPTMQQFFDITVEHLRSQKEQAAAPDRDSHNQNYVCRYRSVSEKDGTVLKCAIGVHIPDEIYVPDMDPMGVGRLISNFPIVHSYVPAEADLYCLEAIQNCHDNDSNWDENGFTVNGETSLESFASRYGLTYVRPE